MKLRIASLFIAMLAFAGVASAQAPKPAAFGGIFQPYVDGSITTAPGSPATGASYSVGAGIESNTNRLLLDVNGSFNTAKVTSGTGSGYNGTITGQGYYKLFSHVLAGGGASVVINTNGFTFSNFASTARNSANPFVGAGLQAGRFRSILTYQLPGKDAVAGQRNFQFSNELAVSRHFRLTVPVGVNSIGGRYTATSVGGGVKLVL
jgi:hypothetical protein